MKNDVKYYVKIPLGCFVVRHTRNYYDRNWTGTRRIWSEKEENDDERIESNESVHEWTSVAELGEWNGNERTEKEEEDEQKKEEKMKLFSATQYQY